MFTIADKLGIGIYSPAEAALYARVSRQLMTRWVFGDARGEPVIQRQLRNPSEKVVTFLDFVQTLAVREVRNRCGVPLQSIRQAIDEARQRYGVDYPLASQHKILLASDRKSRRHRHIIIMKPEDDDSKAIQYFELKNWERRMSLGAKKKSVQVGETRIPELLADDFIATTPYLESRKKPGLVINSVVELFVQDIQFEPKTGLATEYSPMSEGNARIVLNPHRRFGEPIVDPSGHTAETLWDATNIEGGMEAAAEAFGVSIDEIRLANRYIDSLQNRAA